MKKNFIDEMKKNLQDRLSHLAVSTPKIRAANKLIADEKIKEAKEKVEAAWKVEQEK